MPKRKHVNSSVEYLNRVLKDWVAFCESHKGIEKAIREVLLENARLKVQLDLMKERYE